MPGNAPPLADERDQLLAFLAQQRDGLRFAAYGLTEEQARQRPTASALSVGGLIKHVATTEQGWMDNVLQRERAADGGEADYHAGFALGPDETLSGALDRMAEVAAETESIVRGLDIDHRVPVPDAPWFPKDVEAWSLRWVLLHLIEEVGRHAGHADIVRESIDGATMYELMAGAEGWPETEWLQPWKPTGQPSV